MMPKAIVQPARTRTRGWRRHAAAVALRRFRDDEDGSMLIFGLFCFVMMLYLAGVAIDLMRYEDNRTRLQNTADRAALAAAELDQKLDARDVVRDYFAKEGLTPPRNDQITVRQGAFGEWRTVTVDTDETMPTWFMNLFGIDTLVAPALSTAEERIGNVEISLVLDVSGSMNSNNRLANLKPAAKDFIDTMFDSVEAGRLSMNIINYSTQVSAGNDILKYYRITNEHADSRCIDFDLADYNTAATAPKSTPQGFPEDPADRQYQLNGHFEPFNSITASAAGPDWAANALTNCPPTAASQRNIKVMSGSRSQLKAYVDNMTAGGNTSIDIGVKWGAALLDPSFSPVVTGLIAEGKVDNGFADRPLAYNNREAIKVLVVMSDGENTTEYRLKDAYDHGNSRLMANTAYANPGDINQYSLYDSSRNKYWVFRLGQWRNEPWGDAIGDTGDALPLTWQDVWKRMSVNWFADRIISPVYGSTERNKWRTSASNAIATTAIYSDKDARTQAICTATKNHGVKIYSIGFEAPSRGITLLRDCATAPANFYSVSGLDIKTAFASIASSINKLRLTQ